MIYSSNKIISKFSDNLSKINPKLVILLGDRFEVFGAAYASFILKIPIAHISGGDVTMGAQDDVFRHCITKMFGGILSQQHFKKELFNWVKIQIEYLMLEVQSRHDFKYKILPKKYIENKTGLNLLKKYIYNFSSRNIISNQNN